jgi:aldose 1-epimerase
MATTVTCDSFGTLEDGSPAERYTLISSTGMAAQVLTLGATLHSLTAPDRQGRLDNVVLGCSTVDDYLSQRAYLGAVVGRYANRTAGGRFELDGVVYHLVTNESPNALHGGHCGFDRRNWSCQAFEEGAGVGVVLVLASPDGDQGFPGKLDVQVRYFLVEHELRVTYRATTDRPTVVNLTNHTDWNLAREAAETVEGHVVWINARRYTPVQRELLPVGTIEIVLETPFDFFTAPGAIGERIAAGDEELRLGGGYDHNFVLSQTNTGRPLALQHALSIRDQGVVSRC